MKKELNDSEFDAAFRKKVFDADLQFEEAAWNKMEQKLRRRDRVVFFRKAGAICLLLLIGFAGYLVMNSNPAKDGGGKMVSSGPARTGAVAVPEAGIKAIEGTSAEQSELLPVLTYTKRSGGRTNRLQANVLLGKASVDSARRDSLVQPGAQQLLVQQEPVKPHSDLNQADAEVTASAGTGVLPAAVASVAKKTKTSRNRTLPMSLSLSIGPEFNSAAALIGGKKGFSAGLGFSLGVARRITLQTGVKYSRKDYAADNYAYQFRNPRIKDLVTKVDASCAVLEVPLQASYTFWDDAGKSIDVNVGVSSYFMLKEDYTYRYTEGSGIGDRYQEYNNRNQHYFGVADLSATYYIKLKKEKLQLGLEPYVKLPLTGVGEGKVNLKSSGLSLKLRYDLGKKNN
ncbi:outer membrane beta-barrel protein [Pedobacter africanus]|uniref:Outer membrane protein beta-barrel domain-containing protein n=1 Tax=Pedobacter africanus TaxID=151894 RepID=A0A1W1ZQH3_9SPHI|nr:outer membrane beta-barrel protein [Pedobacter africanus]SMC50644.1 Outer membrane protein beta-barrel domain-containing protein [Pedobacter africanus]